jgi:2-polyprenyl-3-methyl-5-hydroxy-6-metoxy-1,4-benzoquinol methylase
MNARDFRGELYRQYVTGFKGLDQPMDAKSLQSYLDWCRFKYGPLVAELSRDAPLLEVRCGPGNLLLYLAAEGFTKARGIDISEEQVQIALERGLDAEVADVFGFLPQVRTKFQVVFAIDFVEHFDRNELLALLRLIHGVLDTEGLLIVQTPNGQGLFPRQVIYADLTHLTILSPSSLRQALQLAGFCDVRFEETGPVPKDIRGKGRVMLWKAVKLVANLIRVIETGKTQRIWTENLICVARKCN